MDRIYALFYSPMSIGNAPSDGWYTKSMSSKYFGYINKTGITQVRLRFNADDNNKRVADYLSFYTGETGTTANPPTLTINYSIP